MKTEAVLPHPRTTESYQGDFQSNHGPADNLISDFWPSTVRQ